jgi:hypothetical protein
MRQPILTVDGRFRMAFYDSDLDSL